MGENSNKKKYCRIGKPNYALYLAPNDYPSISMPTLTEQTFQDINVQKNVVTALKDIPRVSTAESQGILCR